MKKKYPFSKKAVKAMLVAALALTPAASFGVGKVAAETQVPAENYDKEAVADLIERLDTVYDQLSDGSKNVDDNEKQDLRDAQKILNAITETEWQTYAKEIFKDNTKTVKQSQLLKAIASLTISTNTTELNEKIEAFQAANASNITEVFGDGVTIDAMVAYVADVEILYLDSIESLIAGKTDAKVSGFAMAEALQKAMKDASVGHTNVKTALETKLNDQYTVAIQLVKLTNQIDPGQEARDAFVSAVRKAYNAAHPPVIGPGGGGGLPPVVEPPAPGEVTIPEGATETVKQGSTVVTQVPASKVAEIVTQITADKAVIPLTLDAPAAGETAKAQLPAALFTQAAEKNKDAAVNVKTEEASYQLPVSEINVAALANELGVAAADVKIEISVNVVPQSQVKADLDNNKLNAVSDVIEFTVKAVSGDKELSVSKFSTYVKRTIVGNKTFNPARTAAVKLVNGKFQGAPATFKGKEATIFKKDNSKYVIVENDKTFADVNNGKNFAEASIEKLASKYIIFGKSDTEYANSLAITRGEFAALISRALGLTAQDPTQLKFTDTPSTKAVNQNGEINAVAEAGIVSGYAGNIFKPDQQINRAEAAIMLSKALDYVKVASSQYTTSKKLADFKDDAVIGTTSRQYVEKVYQAGLMSGFSDKSFGPDKSMQRDQMAVVLDKLLQAAKLID